MNDEVGERDVCAGVEGFAKVVEKDSQDCQSGPDLLERRLECTIERGCNIKTK